MPAYEIESGSQLYDHKVFTQQIGEVLSEIITEKGMTQQDVANLLNMSRQALNEVLVTGGFSFKRFMRLCNLLDLEFTLTIRTK